jgi:molybdopterin synthase catalytic subunit
MSSQSVKIKNIFFEGAISPQFIADSIAKHQTKHSIGAHNIFMGQVRADQIEGKTVSAIEYTAYNEMALEKIAEIREDTFTKFDLTCLHVHHSLGVVKTGEICLFVFVSSKRRTQVYEATEYLVDQIKAHLPIFGKELFEDDTHQWKVNS